MSTQAIQTFSRFSELSDPLAVQVLSYTPVTALASVSKAFRGLQEKLMEQIWMGMKSNPLLDERVRALSPAAFSTLCFQALLNQQRKLAERTPAGFNAFQKLQQLEAGSYAHTRFIQAEPIISDVDKEQDDNLWKVWIANQGLRDKLVAFLGDTPPQNAAEVRTWMNASENQAHLDTITVLPFNNLGLTAFPPELAKCREAEYIIGVQNSIRELPDWFAQFTQLKNLYMTQNSLDRVPEVLMRLPKNIEHISLYQNPIRTISEPVYRHFYSWKMWLGWDFFFSFGRTLFISHGTLKVMPFSLYLESFVEDFNNFIRHIMMKVKTFGDTLLELVSNDNLKQYWIAIFGNSETLLPLGDLVCSILSLIRSSIYFVSTYLMVVPSLTFIGIIWLLSRVYLWAIIPTATLIREMLGYGRMISL